MHSEEAQRAAARIGPSAPYNESVKRHLEGYDVEASLNEVKFFTMSVCFTMILTLGVSGIIDC
jgi:hypothetical protein